MVVSEGAGSCALLCGKISKYRRLVLRNFAAQQGLHLYQSAHLHADRPVKVRSRALSLRIVAGEEELQLCMNSQGKEAWLNLQLDRGFLIHSNCHASSLCMLCSSVRWSKTSSLNSSNVGNVRGFGIVVGYAKSGTGKRNIREHAA
jgi:hypothetical protein